MMWQRDKKWSDQFLPVIKRILGELLIGEPWQEEDTFHNTDLMVLKMEAVRIACRIRRPNYYPFYKNEFTIRAERPQGTKTELAKILEGWGDYFFYGFAAEQPGGLAHWEMGSLPIFRLWFLRYITQHKGICPGQWIENRDHSSAFRVFQWTDLPANFRIAFGENKR